MLVALYDQIIYHENEAGWRFPHLLTMGDGCPFRPLILIIYLMQIDYIIPSIKASNLFQGAFGDKVPNPVGIEHI